MQSQPPRKIPAAASGSVLLVAVLAAGVFVAACGPIKQDPSGAIAITIRPGETGSCATQPCTVSLAMPAGSGSYAVTSNQIRIGMFPAGETVVLGRFYEPQVIRIEKAGVPNAYVYIPTSI